MRLTQVGAFVQELLELDARRRPVLLRHERRRQGEPSRDGIGLAAEGRAQLVDRRVEIAHAVEGEPEARASLDQIGLPPQRLAQHRRGRRHLAAGDQGLALFEIRLRTGLGRRRRGSDSHAPCLSDSEQNEETRHCLRHHNADTRLDCQPEARSLLHADRGIWVAEEL